MDKTSTKTARISVRLTPEDYARLEDFCLEFGTSQAKILRQIVAQILVGGSRQVKLTRPPSVFDADALKEVRKIGINFNQLARSGNLGALGHQDQEHLSQIRVALHQLLRRLQ